MAGGETTDVLLGEGLGAHAPPIAAPPIGGRRIAAMGSAGRVEPVRVGDRVGPYRLRRCLGEANGRVAYAAWDDLIARPVALVVLSPSRSDRDGAYERFIDEARARARVRHVNVSEVYAMGTIHGAPWVAMESPVGQSLRIRLLHTSRGPTFSEASALFEGLCRGAQAIHDAGLVHGGLGPGNVVVTPANRVVITDLPLHDPLAFPLPQWSMGPYARRVGYVAPEAGEGRGGAPSRHARADVHSLGVLGLELFAGVEPDLHHAVRDALLPAITSDPSRCPASPSELLGSVRAAARRARAAGHRTVLVVAARGRGDRIAGALYSRDPELAVVRAEDGRTGLERVRTDRVDLVLADARMPDMDAETFVQGLHARSDGASVPVVIVSEPPTGARWRRLHALGVADLVPVPFDEAMLWATIGRLLGPASLA